MSKNLGEGISKGRRQGEQTTPEEEGTVSFGPTYAVQWGGSTCSLPIMPLPGEDGTTSSLIRCCSKAPKDPSPS